MEHPPNHNLTHHTALRCLPRGQCRNSRLLIFSRTMHFLVLDISRALPGSITCDSDSILNDIQRDAAEPAMHIIRCKCGMYKQGIQVHVHHARADDRVYARHEQHTGFMNGTQDLCLSAPNVHIYRTWWYTLSAFDCLYASCSTCSDPNNVQHFVHDAFFACR